MQHPLGRFHLPTLTAFTHSSNIYTLSALGHLLCVGCLVHGFGWGSFFIAGAAMHLVGPSLSSPHWPCAWGDWAGAPSRIGATPVTLFV